MVPCDYPLTSCSYGTLQKVYEASTAQMLIRIQSSRGLLVSPSTTTRASMDWSTILLENGVIEEKVEQIVEDDEELSGSFDDAVAWDDLDAIFELEL
jgi:hypothetical protein